MAVHMRGSDSALAKEILQRRSGPAARSGKSLHAQAHLEASQAGNKDRAKIPAKMDTQFYIAPMKRLATTRSQCYSAGREEFIEPYLIYLRTCLTLYGQSRVCL